MGCKKDAIPRDHVIASATRILLKAFAQNDQCLKQKFPSFQEVPLNIPIFFGVFQPSAYE